MSDWSYMYLTLEGIVFENGCKLHLGPVHMEVGDPR